MSEPDMALVQPTAEFLAAPLVVVQRHSTAIVLEAKATSLIVCRYESITYLFGVT
jgi:hypothetical protein